MDTGSFSTVAVSLGGQLWLELVNTEIVKAGHPLDLIATPAQFSGWATAVELPFKRLASEEAGQVLETAHQLRRELRLLAEHIEEGKQVPRKAVERINEVLGTRLVRSQLSSEAGQFVIRQLDESHEIGRWLAPVAESVAQFLVEGEWDRLHRCANPNCVIHFYDATKNRGRRFCSPATCGNRIKVAAHYRRKRAAAGHTGNRDAH